MEQTYQYAWILPFVPLPVPMLIGVGLLLFPTATKNLHRIWAFPSILLLSIVMIFSTNLSIQQINSSSIYQYVWSWTLDNDFSLEFGYLIDPLTSIMSMLITTVGIMVLIYSDNYMAHDQGYLRFFAYMSFFSTSMLGLVTSSNLIQIYIFWELVGMCSYLLIGFWFTRPPAANACQKAFVTNRVGDFGLLLGILGFYWITGSFEFRDLFEILNNLIYNNEVNFPFVTLCAALLFAGAVAKSAQFPLHVWLPDAMEGPTPISALIHAATMVAAGIFLVARLLPLFIVIPYIMNLISVIGVITLLLGATLALAQKDIKRGLAYSTMSQLGYMMLALGMGSYRSALFHLITHAYSKALLFLGSGSVIHSMETIVGYSPDKSQNMVLMGGLTKHVPITKTSFFIRYTFSLWYSTPCLFLVKRGNSERKLVIFADFRNNSLGHSRINCILYVSYLFTCFRGAFKRSFSKLQRQPKYLFLLHIPMGKRMFKKNKPKFSIYKERIITKVFLLRKKTYRSDENVRKKGRGINIVNFDNQKPFSYPYESDNTMLFPLLLLVLFTLFVGSLGIPFNQKARDLDILSKWLAPSIHLLDQKTKDSTGWDEFWKDAIFSVSIAYFGIFLASTLYKPIYSSFQNFDLINSFVKLGPKRKRLDKIINTLYNWSYNRAYIDAFYTTSFTGGIRGLARLTHFFDRRVIDGIVNGVGVMSFFVGEGIKYVGGGRISSYLFFYFLCVSIFVLVYLFSFFHQIF
uniref:NAD(P)H-quinone oxidoreductase subunit 5, chloroplastic n=1 Tax=Teucrium mascatense TaxID=2172029 RepID=A0A4Y6I4I3_9LAMI|nr:NADH-plastoquinone oxidoreductase subunit 5 [Teucrium mascatense]QDF64494.1 NADH-plastoquinone oxidoreductase subunit 5 [Teucrium mascatense]